MAAKVAIVGAGLMGGNMALALHAAGVQAVGYDVRKASIERLRAQGVEATSDLKEAIDGADFIISSLPNSHAVRKAWLAAEGVLSYARSGAVAIEMSSIDPDTMKQLAAACIEMGVAALDVPVSGGPNEALEGKLVLLIGGEQAVIERGKPVLDLLGASWHHTGGVGTAKVVKLVNNLMTMGNVLVAAEAFALGTAAGVDPDRLYEVLTQCGGRSHHFIKRFPNALKRDFAPGFKIHLGEKDVSLAIEVARAIGQPMPTASHVREMYMMAMSLGYRDKDIVGLLDMFQRMNAGEAFVDAVEAPAEDDERKGSDER